MASPSAFCEVGLSSMATKIFLYMVAAPLFEDHGREGPDVGLGGDEQAHQGAQGDGVEEDVAQDLSFMAIPVRGGGGDDDGLGIDHLAHDAARAVGGGH